MVMGNTPPNDEQERDKTFTRRSLIVGGGMTALLSTLVARMYYLQVMEADRFLTMAEENRINLRLIRPSRGSILDRFGEPLAVNRQNFRALIVAEDAGEVEETLDRFSQIVALDQETRERIIRDIRRKRKFVPVTMRDNLTWDQVSRLEVNAPNLPGINIEVGETRHYPYRSLTSQVIGHVGAVSEKELTGDPVLELPGFRIGKKGVERQNDLALRGTAGRRQVEVNAMGRVIRELNRDDALPGSDTVLTIDAKLQVFAQQRMMGEKSASAVVMDVHSGEVLALASVPSFDPELFVRGLSTQQWRNLINDPLGPLNNKAISGLYNPGSTFKMLVAIAALESGIGPGYTVYCPGHMRLGNHRFHCWRRWGHGKLDMRDALKQSCDVWYYDVAWKVGIEKIAEVARRFGLGERVGIDLPGERGGVVPTKAWKLANIGEPWQGGETLVNAIGQGFVLTSPLQLAVMTARLVNGGKAVTPRLTRGFHLEDPLAKEHPPVQGPFPDIGVSEHHLALMRDAMDAVVNERRGTARGSKIEEEGFEMGGKTGTSQVRRITKEERAAGVIKNEDLPWHRRDHALFVGYAPIKAPRYCCSVVVEHGGGGSKVAAPIARDLLLEAQRRDPISRVGVRVVSSETVSQQS